MLVLAQRMRGNLYQRGSVVFGSFLKPDPRAPSKISVCRAIVLVSFMLTLQVKHHHYQESLYIFVESLLGEQQPFCACEFSSVPLNHILIWSFSSFCLTGKMPALKIQNMAPDPCSENSWSRSKWMPKENSKFEKKYGFWSAGKWQAGLRQGSQFLDDSSASTFAFSLLL